MTPTDCAPAQRTSIDRSTAGPALSIVTTLFRSAAFLPEFIERCRSVLRDRSIEQYEIVFVDDGSPDNSREYVLQARSDDPRIKLVDLSRNFGHHRAALAGLRHARGERVFLIDCDLEVPPAILADMLDAMDDSRADVVYGYQAVRSGAGLERLGGKLFWWLYNHLSDTRIPHNVLTERLMTRRYVDALLTLGDRNIFLAGMMYWTGFEQVGIPVAKGVRHGPSTYSFRRRISLLVEAVTSFSTVPLKLTLWIGLTFLVVSFGFAGTLALRKLLYPDTLLLGYTTLLMAIVAMGGVILTLMGVLGIYLSRLFIQAQDRPLYIVRDYKD
jgi:putative glycosyltransferase